MKCEENTEDYFKHMRSLKRCDFNIEMVVYLGFNDCPE